MSKENLIFRNENCNIMELIQYRVEIVYCRSDRRFFGIRFLSRKEIMEFSEFVKGLDLDRIVRMLFIGGKEEKKCK